MYLLDTNVLSELRKLQNGKADPNFTKWFAAISVDQLYVSVITLFEIENGVLLLERKDAVQAAILRDWFQRAQAQLEGRVLPIDQAAALYCAKITVPNPRPWRDAFIGATAYVHGFILVTRNVRDFQGIAVEIINPWDKAS
jgi:predicted nucleic acid-binding protein